MNQSRMKRISRSATMALTSSGVCGRSADMAGSLVHRGFRSFSRRGARASAVRAVLSAGRASAAPRPRARGPRARARGPSSVSSYSTRTGRPGRTVRTTTPARLELLHALGQQAVGQLGDRVGDLAEAQGRAVDEHADDRAGPAAADELDRLVVQRAAGRPRCAPSRSAAACGGQPRRCGVARPASAQPPQSAGGRAQLGVGAAAAAPRRRDPLRPHGARDRSPRPPRGYAARSVRVSSTDPSTGTSPATFTIAVKRSSAT